MVSKLDWIFRANRYSSRPRIVGTSMVLIRDQSIMLLTSRGRFRFRLGTRAKARARFIFTNCPRLDRYSAASTLRCSSSVNRFPAFLTPKNLSISILWAWADTGRISVSPETNPNSRLCSQFRSNSFTPSVIPAKRHNLHYIISYHILKEISSPFFAASRR